jgi:hypothetical protein
LELGILAEVEDGRILDFILWLQTVILALSLLEKKF